MTTRLNIVPDIILRKVIKARKGKFIEGNYQCGTSNFRVATGSCNELGDSILSKWIIIYENGECILRINY